MGQVTFLAVPFDVHDPADLRRSRKAHAHELTVVQRAVQHERALVARRDRQLKALQRQGHGASAAVRYALDHRGVHEDPGRANRGTQVDAWNIASGVLPGPGAYWCQSFVNACVRAGGVEVPKSGYTVWFVEASKPGGALYRAGWRHVPVHEARPGDLVYFKWPGVSRDFCDHVGIAVGAGKDVEGNTSPGNSSSQNNGGGVYLRGWTTESSRRPYVVAVIRPPYK